jgi:hypothetical protein
VKFERAARFKSANGTYARYREVGVMPANDGFVRIGPVA